MRVSALFALLPLAIAAPATKQITPELSVNDWHSIQSGFVDRLWTGVADWTWNKAEAIVEEYATAGDQGKTVYQQLKDDDQFSKVVKAIDVSICARSIEAMIGLMGSLPSSRISSMTPRCDSPSL